MTYWASWTHEPIFRRPKREDSPSPRARDGQERSSPHLLRRKRLLHKTLRRTRRGWPIARPQEEARLETQARRASQQAARRGHKGAPFRHSAAEVRVPAGGGLLGGQPLHRMCRATKRMNSTRKRGKIGRRTRRVLEGRLEDDGSRGSEP